MKFDILTIFPDMVRPYFSETILERAQKEGHLEINVHDLRDYSQDKHASVDDEPYGGGPGMVMQVGPIYRAVKDLESQKSRVILLSPKGEQFNQNKAENYSDMEHLILICGRYEGVDERVHKHIADEVLSVGPYVLSGGEIAAMAVVESTARLIPGVLGNEKSLAEESHQEKIEKEYPQYTRPRDFEAEGNNWSVPDILLSGDHQAVDKWRQEHSEK